MSEAAEKATKDKIAALYTWYVNEVIADAHFPESGVAAAMLVQAHVDEERKHTR